MRKTMHSAVKLAKFIMLVSILDGFIICDPEQAFNEVCVENIVLVTPFPWLQYDSLI